ncbi:MAG: alcohol dehydrogenase catalytic domain-containing protein [Polyangiales bacterium]
MLALSRQAGTVRLSQVGPPQRGPEEALVRVQMAGICNTDLEIARGYMGFDGVLGHEFVGVVEDCADASWVGARVTGEINLACGHCALCQRGLPRHCSQRTVLGILGKDGAFAEYLTLPVANLHRVPEGLSNQSACFVEPLAACFEILEQVTFAPNDRVAVLGDGKLGQLAALVLTSQGHDAVLVGKHDDKLQRARQLGLRTAIARELSYKTYDVVVEATGSPTGLALAVALTRPRGTLVLKSTYHGAVSLDTAPLVIDEIHLVGSRCGPFPPAIAAIASEQLVPAALIDEVFPLRDGERAFERAAQPGVLKVLLQMA